MANNFKTILDDIKKHNFTGYQMFQLILSTETVSGNFFGYDLIEFSEVEKTLQRKKVREFLFSLTRDEFLDVLKKLEVLDIDYSHFDHKKIYIDWKQLCELIESGTVKKGSLYACPGGARGTVQYLPKEQAFQVTEEYKAEKKKAADELEVGRKTAKRITEEKYSEE